MSAKRCTGTRYFENLVDESKTTLEDQYMALAERYMKINCACFTPNEGRIDDILRLAREYKVDGIIDVNLKFCNLYDTEGYFVEKAMKEAISLFLESKRITPTATPDSFVPESVHLSKC